MKRMLQCLAYGCCLLLPTISAAHDFDCPQWQIFDYGNNSFLYYCYKYPNEDCSQSPQEDYLFDTSRNFPCECSDGKPGCSEINVEGNRTAFPGLTGKVDDFFVLTMPTEGQDKFKNFGKVLVDPQFQFVHFFSHSNNSITAKVFLLALDPSAASGQKSDEKQIYVAFECQGTKLPLPQDMHPTEIAPKAVEPNVYTDKHKKQGHDRPIYIFTTAQ